MGKSNRVNKGKSEIMDKNMVQRIFLWEHNISSVTLRESSLGRDHKKGEK